MKEGSSPEHIELKPNVPKWFRENQAENYNQVLREELERIVTDPDAYFGKQKISWADFKKENNLSSKEIKQLALAIKNLIDKEFSFDTVGARIAELLQELNQNSGKLVKDGQDYVQELARRVHWNVLRRMVKEYLPERKAVVHRGSFKQYSEKAEQYLPKAVLKRISNLGSAGNLLKFLIKDNSFHIEETKENLEQGIGGFEFDVKLNQNGEPIITHAFLTSDKEKSPTLDEVLSMVRELLPEDKDQDRSARRGLKLFLHIKISSSETVGLERVMRTIDRYGLGNQVYIQTGRAETLYELDLIEDKLKSKNAGRALTRYSYQTLPLVKWPSGKTLEVLQKHHGLVSTPAVIYNKGMLAKVQALGLGLHIGANDNGEKAQEMLESDEERRSPHSIMAIGKDVVFPKKRGK